MVEAGELLEHFQWLTEARGAHRLVSYHLKNTRTAERTTDLSHAARVDLTRGNGDRSGRGADHRLVADFDRCRRAHHLDYGLCS